MLMPYNTILTDLSRIRQAQPYRHS